MRRRRQQQRARKKKLIHQLATNEGWVFAHVDPHQIISFHISYKQTFGLAVRQAKRQRPLLVARMCASFGLALIEIYLYQKAFIIKTVAYRWMDGAKMEKNCHRSGA
jgi:hypothetical protein